MRELDGSRRSDVRILNVFHVLFGVCEDVGHFLRQVLQRAPPAAEVLHVGRAAEVDVRPRLHVHWGRKEESETPRGEEQVCSGTGTSVRKPQFTANVSLFWMKTSIKIWITKRKEWTKQRNVDTGEQSSSTPHIERRRDFLLRGGLVQEGMWGTQRPAVFTVRSSKRFSERENNALLQSKLLHLKKGGLSGGHLHRERQGHVTRAYRGTSIKVNTGKLSRTFLRK